MMRLRSTFMRGRMGRRMFKREAVPLNLVSMIDIFTTLVFFLLLTSTSVQTLHSPRSMQLPSSTTTMAPNDAPVVMVTPTDISIQGRFVMSVADAEAAPDDLLPPLAAELQRVEKAQIEGAEAGKLTRGDINIMADKDIPYSLLKRVIRTCGQSEFAHISLSVNHVSRRASS
ncbi:MAG: biopolymer transporter ExbD [Nevskia sp.]|nr:biopolymer transporter ExbD [Nevskia sp.]